MISQMMELGTILSGQFSAALTFLQISAFSSLVFFSLNLCCFYLLQFEQRIALCALLVN